MKKNQTTVRGEATVVFLVHTLGRGTTVGFSWGFSALSPLGWDWLVQPPLCSSGGKKTQALSYSKSLKQDVRKNNF